MVRNMGSTQNMKKKMLIFSFLKTSLSVSSMSSVEEKPTQFTQAPNSLMLPADIQGSVKRGDKGGRFSLPNPIPCPLSLFPSSPPPRVVASLNGHKMLGNDNFLCKHEELFIWDSILIPVFTPLTPFYHNWGVKIAASMPPLRCLNFPLSRPVWTPCHCIKANRSWPLCLNGCNQSNFIKTRGVCVCMYMHAYAGLSTKYPVV